MIKIQSTRLKLAEILEVIGDNDLHWSILDIYGTSIKTCDLNMLDLEKNVDLSWVLVWGGMN